MLSCKFLANHVLYIPSILWLKKLFLSCWYSPVHGNVSRTVPDISAQQTRRNKLGAGQTRRRSNSAQVKLGAGQTRRNKLGAGQTRRRPNSAQAKLGAGQTRRRPNSAQVKLGTSQTRHKSNSAQVKLCAGQTRRRKKMN